MANLTFTQPRFILLDSSASSAWSALSTKRIMLFLPKTSTMKNLFILLTCIAFFTLSCQTPSDTLEDDLVTQLHEIFKADQQPQNEEEERPLFRDISIEKEEEKAANAKALLDKLNAIDRAALPKSEQINYDMFKYILEDRIAQVEYETYLMPINSEGGFHTGFQMRMSRANFKKEEDIKRHIDRLAGFKDHTMEYIDLMKQGLEKGLTPPQVILRNYESMVKPFAKGSATESFFYKPFQDLPAWLDEDKKEQFQQAAQQAITESVIPAYQALDDFLANEYIPNARQSLGATDLPNGKEYYEQRIRYFTTLPMTSDEVFKKGEEEVERIRAEMQQIIDDLNFKGSFADFLNFLRTDPQFYAKTPKALLSEASFLSKKIEARLPEFFNKLPRNPFGVAPVPDAIAPTYTGGRYVPGSLKNHRSGTYWVNTYKLESRPLYVLPALTLHEAVPGHHLQMSLAQELEGLPSFRNSTYLSAFGEGWALYTEWLGIEAGMYETPYTNFGRLTYEMWRACRLVVDVGLHAKGWTRDQAVEFMASNTALSLHEVNTEIDRYIGWPGQAVSYKIGELKIRALRKKAEQELGDQFNIRDFHDVILSNGSVPLFVLEDMVEDYINEAQKEPLKS